MARAGKAKVGVVIPAYGHPVLLTEAIESVLAQQCSFDVVIVIVSDGCPLRETDVVCSAYCSASEKVFYIRTANGGPSSARNRGIEFLLRNWGDIEAIFFLDADNRLRPNALQIAFDGLATAPFEVGWVYSNIDTFGVRWSGNCTFPYSPLLHVTAVNMCDTGSLVSRKVFEHGIRFDEDSRSGFEDWDFWLQCLDKGFIGQPIHFGLEYRKRPESRNEQNLRNSPAIMSHMRSRHKHLSSAKNLLNWEHLTNPRYLFGVSNLGEWVYESFTDPSESGQLINVDKLGEIFWSSLHAPDENWFPAYLAWAIPGLREYLGEAKLLHNVFFLMEKYARSHNFSALTVSNSDKVISIDIDADSDDPTLAYTGAMWMCSSKIAKEIVLDSSTDWVNSLRTDRSAPSICKINISIPGLAKCDLSGNSALESMLDTVRTFRASEYVSSKQVRWHWRPQRYSSRDEYYTKLCGHLGVDGLMPRVSKSTIDIGLVLPFATYGGAEKVAFALARTLVKHGMRVHIFVIGDPCLTVIDEFHSSLTSINILAEKDFPKWGGPLTVFGQESFAPDSPEIRASLLGGFLAGLDLLINCHSAPMNALINTAKGMGAKTATYLHVFDTTNLGRLVGHPYLTIPFEHGYDLILTCSEALKQDLHALGVPEEKILSIPNAAGFRLGDNARERAVRQRTAPRNNRRLHLLYLGRLDRQKGVDRLFNLIVALRNKVVPVDIRIIGSTLLDAEENWVARFSSIGLEVEDPIYETKDLQDAYIWADVLLLPSRWEGAPLVIPECQQTGCIPIAMKVGAVEELIKDGVDGILIPNRGEHRIITEYCAWIDALIDNDKLRMELSEKAFGRGAASTWDHNYDPFLTWLQKEFNLAFSPKKGSEIPASPKQDLGDTNERDIEFAKELV